MKRNFGAEMRELPPFVFSHIGQVIWRALGQSPRALWSGSSVAGQRMPAPLMFPLDRSEPAIPWSPELDPSLQLPDSPTGCFADSFGHRFKVDESVDGVDGRVVHDISLEVLVSWEDFICS